MRKTCIKEREAKDMKITELKIKENISPDVIAEAIEYIANSCFISGTYNPYYRSFAEKMAIVQFFLDGIEFEEGDSLFVICELEEVKKLIDKFYGDKRFKEQAALMEVINSNVDEVVDFKKQRLIHGADAIESIANTIGVFGNFVSDLDIALGNLAKLDLSNINKEEMEKVTNIINRLNDSGVELNAETVSQVIKDAVNYDIDKASQEIIDAKNKEIEELKRRNAKLEKEHNARNVLAYKKEVDE